MHFELAARGDYEGEATFNGRLYLVRHYPGVVESDNACDQVHGELYRLREPAVAFALDAYESCGPQTSQPAEYVRVTKPIVCADGTVVMAWIYLYNRSVEHLPLIPSGRYLSPSLQ